MVEDTCPEFEDLSIFVEAGGTLEAAEDVRAHLDECAECRALVEDIRDSNRLAREMRGICEEVLEHSGLISELNLVPASTGPSPIVLPHFIENYDVIEEIGRGGMGVVYRANQKATKREVALKVLLEGPFASKSARQRFEREVELAAQLDHPGIVTVLESGVDSGRYYFAMQYIRGQRLDQWVAEKKPTVEEKLRLFVKIGDAITHAHQRGVIHRDLKPSNILIDEAGNPHILDFGLAKLSGTEGQMVSQPSLLSMTGQVVGTLPYLSPEQASDERHPADVRTDVYGLGVMLYQVLTGQYPYNVTGQMLEVLRSIRESEPKRPTRCADGLDEEIDTIVLKALSKDPERRYQSVADLSHDIEHYLNGEPLDARRDSQWYLFRKTLRRHRVSVGVVSGLFVASVVIAILFAGLFRNARVAQREAEDSRDIATMAVSLVPFESAELKDHFSNIRHLKRFLAENPDNLEAGEVRSRLEQEKGEAIEKIANVRNDNQHDQLIALLHDDPQNCKMLEELERDYPESGIRGKIVEDLESILHVPFLTKRAQITLNAMDVLETLEPGNRKVSNARKEWDESIENMETFYPAVFDLTSKKKSGWTEAGTFEEGSGNGTGNRLVLSGSETSVCSAKWAFSNTIMKNFSRWETLLLSMDITVLSLSEHKDHPHGVNIGFCSSAYNVCSVSLDRDKIRLNNTESTDMTLSTGHLDVGRVYHVDLFYRPHMGTIDVMVDGIFLAEDIMDDSTWFPDGIIISAHYQNSIAVDNIVVRVSQERNKLYMDTVLPRIAVGDDSLSLSQYKELDTNRGIALQDFDGDTIPEIYTLEQTLPDTLSTYQPKLPTYLVCSKKVEGHQEQLREAGRLELGELGVSFLSFNDSGVMIMSQSVKTSDGRDLSDQSKITLIGANRKGQPRTAFSMNCDDSYTGCTSTFKIDEQRQGLFVASNYYSKQFAVYEILNDGDYPTYKLLCSSKQAGYNAHLYDIRSLNPIDWDQDGDDDFIAGQGLWHGECPAVILMEDGKPVDFRAGGSKDPVKLDGLYFPSGPTTSLLSSFGTDEEYLIAASSRSDAKPKKGIQRRPPGVRIWRVDDLRRQPFAEPLFFTPCLSSIFCTGRLNREEVLAFAFEEDPGTGHRDQQVHLIAYREGKFERIWSVELYSKDSFIVNLMIDDLDGDSENELIVALRNPGGLMIFEAVNTQSN